VHRDVKPENVLLDVHLTAKLADVGLAKFMPRPVDSLIRYVKRHPLREGWLCPHPCPHPNLNPNPTLTLTLTLTLTPTLTLTHTWLS
jgi:serine/threonine protein kinase